MDSTKYKRFYVYGLTDPITGEVRYVGVTGNLWQRFKAHLKDSLPSGYCNRLRRNAWIASLRQRGLVPGVKVLEVVPPRKRVARELAWIRTYMKAGADLLNDDAHSAMQRRFAAARK